jgi:hypothetical protein
MIWIPRFLGEPILIAPYPTL